MTGPAPARWSRVTASPASGSGRNRSAGSRPSSPDRAADSASGSSYRPAAMHRKRIRLLVVEDDELVRTAFANLLDTTPGLNVVGTAGSCEEAVERASRCGPDIAMVDLMLPGRPPLEDGVDVVRELSKRLPETRSVILTGFGSGSQLNRALAAGARGFLCKSTSLEQLTEALAAVMAGQRVVAAELASLAVLAATCPLTAREAEILCIVRAGASLRDIARQVGLSEGTVRNYISRILAKTGTPNRHAAASFAAAQGWL